MNVIQPASIQQQTLAIEHTNAGHEYEQALV
jgi:hypothetical protein